MSRTEPTDPPTPPPPPPEPRPKFAGPFQILCLTFAVLWVVAHRDGSLPRGLAAVAILEVLHLSGSFVAGRLAGARALRVSLLYGGAILRFRVGPTWFSVGSIPLGGYVKFDGYIPAGPRDSLPPGSWGTLPAVARVGVPLAGVTVMVATAVVLLGPARATAAATAVASEAVALFTPSRQAALVGALRRAVSGLPFLSVMGVAAAKTAAVDLLPIPETSGWRAVSNLFWAVTGRYDWPVALQIATVIGTLAFLVVGVEFVYVLLAR